MSRLGKVSRTIEFLRLFGAAEKIQAKVFVLLRKVKELLRKIKKKLKLTALFSVSRNVLFCQENKKSNVDNFFPELDKNPPTSS